MTIKENDNRCETRRSIKMPVTFFLRGKKDNMSDYFFGCTKDVASCGICIYTRPNYIPIVDSLVTLLITPEEKSRFAHTDIPLQIKGQVAWRNKEQHTFGVRFI